MPSDHLPQELPVLRRQVMTRRLFAVIPAAGHSTRMGQPKLLLPLGGSTVVERVIATLFEAGVNECVLVCRPDDSALAQVVKRTPARLVQPEPAPPYMRDSVWAGLQWIEAHCQPTVEDGWLLIPADHPTIDAAVVRQLIAVWTAHGDQIVLPTYHGQRGHPTLFPWSLAVEVGELPLDQGLNQIVRHDRSRVCEVPVSSESVLWDLDTPEDYQRILEHF